jgi:hypothetical protein
MISSSAMPSNKKKAPSSERDYAVGDRVKVNLHTAGSQRRRSKPSSSAPMASGYRWILGTLTNIPMVSECPENGQNASFEKKS